MGKFRVIARLDVKNEYVIKGIHLEGLRKMGNPNEMAEKYYLDGADEVLFMDAVASLYERNNLFDIIQKACESVFAPITIGGGVRTIEDIELSLKAGADKVAINTQLIKRPELVKEAARIFGTQCIVASIEAKKKEDSWEAYIDNGREETGVDVLEHAKRLEDLGAGEIIVTSIDQEGTKKGFDHKLVKSIADLVSIPVIACGGAGNKITDISKVAIEANADAVAVASVLHYNLHSIGEIKTHLNEQGIITSIR